jgi:hypothetical protein
VSMYPLQLRPSPETQANYTVEWLELASQIGPDKFSEALVSAVRSSDYFPIISKIRQCAGVTEKQQNAAGADAAWLYVREHVRKYSSIYECNAPKLPPRIAYAARLVGGLYAIEYCPDDSLPFMRKDFCAAWERYHESSAALNDLMLAAPLEQKLLTAAKPLPPLIGKPKAESETDNSATARVVKMMPERPELTEEELLQRREDMKKKLEEWQAERLKAGKP